MARLSSANLTFENPTSLSVEKHRIEPVQAGLDRQRA
jgi:hypothetical protein